MQLTFVFNILLQLVATIVEYLDISTSSWSPVDWFAWEEAKKRRCNYGN